MSTFDSGFRMANHLKEQWLQDLLGAAGWRSGDRIMACEYWANAVDILNTLKGCEPGETVWLVMAHWANGNPQGIAAKEEADGSAPSRDRDNEPPRILKLVCP